MMPRLTGIAERVLDPERVRALWNEELCAWFSQGAHDPSLALMRVQVDEAEFWDSPSKDEVEAQTLVKLVADETPAMTKIHKLVFASSS
jgi:general stress protein 26